ncbi:MAG: hypothetical protein JWM31_222 [Solirubrobacterales bacterium]|nr:hypothetical protein [Solirubrobacterales bacterium]
MTHPAPLPDMQFRLVASDVVTKHRHFPTLLLRRRGFFSTLSTLAPFPVIPRVKGWNRVDQGGKGGCP